MRIVLGVDPGLASTGYGLIRVENNKNIYLSHGTIETDPVLSLDKRLFYLFTEIVKIIETHQPTEAGVETIYFAKNIKSAIPVAHARGAILAALASKNIITSEHTPLQIKQAVVGNGRAEKEQVQMMVRILLGLKEIPRPDHSADALAVAICHSHTSLVLSYYKK